MGFLFPSLFFFFFETYVVFVGRTTMHINLSPAIGGVHGILRIPASRIPLQHFAGLELIESMGSIVYIETIR